MEGDYRTLLREGFDEFTERRSRFLGAARPVRTEEEAMAFVEAQRQKYWDARHHTYAYLLREGGLARYSDDGEPQGTAGLPLLEVLKKSGVTDAVVVVTRYFGGVLLGKGGLLRAYSHGAALAVNAAGVACMRRCALAQVVCSYSQYGRLAALIPELGGVVDDTEFTDGVTLRFHLTAGDLPRLQKEITEATSGTACVEKTGEKFFAFLEDS